MVGRRTITIVRKYKMPLDLKDIIDNCNIVFDNLMIDGFYLY